MKANSVVTIAAIALVVLSALFIFSNRPIKAEGDNDSAILQKLNDIAMNQKAILDGIESIKRELNIVKIRVTQQQ